MFRGFMARRALTTTLLMATAIAVLSLYPVPQSGLPGSDRAHHFLAYALLSLPLSMVRPLFAPVTFLAASMYGGAIEFVQPAVGRMQEGGDLIANVMGAAVGALLGVCLGFLSSRLAAWREPPPLRDAANRCDIDGSER
jgi:VanZ family protein